MASTTSISPTSRLEPNPYPSPPPPTTDPTTDPDSALLPLIPPLSFSMVSPGVYRSGHPLPINYPMLTLLRLRTIIYLSDLPLPSESYTTFCAAHSIALHHIPVPPVKEPFIENSPEGMHKALLLLLDKRNHPVLIHSNKGKHRVGVLVGCMRKVLQGWSLAATFAEYGRYAGEKGEADLEFIELFNLQLTFDKRYAPSWLRVKYVDDPSRSPSSCSAASSPSAASSSTKSSPSQPTSTSQTNSKIPSLPSPSLPSSYTSQTRSTQHQHPNSNHVATNSNSNSRQ